MAEWCMAHPWMTFWLVALALVVIDNALANFVRGRAFKSCADAFTKRGDRQKRDSQTDVSHLSPEAQRFYSKMLQLMEEDGDGNG